MEQRLRRYRSDRDLSQCGVYVGPDTYRSQWYQGLGVGMEWLRLSLDVTGEVYVCVYVSDEMPGDWDGGRKPAMERTADDLILYGVCGRYLCFTAAPAEGLRGYELAFPGRSIDAGLPAVMQGDNTLRQFLGVYQSLYMDNSRTLTRFSDRLDPLGENPLPGLKRWLGAVRWIKGAPCAARLLSAAPQLNRMRGTRRGLELLLEVVTGGQGKLVEQFQWRDLNLDAGELEDCARLYGAGASGVALLLSDGLPERTIRFLKIILADFIPMGVGYSILSLEDGAPMDGHCYLDVNARLTEPPPAALDYTNLDDLILE